MSDYDNATKDFKTFLSPNMQVLLAFQSIFEQLQKDYNISLKFRNIESSNSICAYDVVHAGRVLACGSEAPLTLWDAAKNIRDFDINKKLKPLWRYSWGIKVEKQFFIFGCTMH